MNRRLLVVLAVALLAALVAAGAVLLGSDGDDEGTEPAATADSVADEPDLGACAGLADDGAARDCYAGTLKRLVEEADDASAALEEIAVAAYTEPDGRLLGDCHGLMHTVGREYARERVTLANLMEHLPQTNEPGCSAGFAHGLLTGVAPEIDVTRPRESAEVCAATETRYQRYSCVHGFGHAFMRIAGEALPEGLALCRALGRVSAPDCAQGAYHDYWFALGGHDDTERPPTAVEDPGAPRRPGRRVRAPVLVPRLRRQPPGGAGRGGGRRRPALRRPRWSPARGVRRGRVGGRPRRPGPPAQPLHGPGGLRRGELHPGDQGAEPAGGAARGPRRARAAMRRVPRGTRVACYRWLGKVLTVMTNGEFESYGCRQAPDAPTRRACVAGARASDGPLETFS